MGGLHLPSALNLARSQFAFVVVWHFLYPAFTIGLASFLAVLEGCWLVTKRAVFLDTFQYWLRIFAIVFAMGVVSGVVMSYQFGSNWSVFSDKVGPVIGPFLGYEVLTAFFLEAGFLGVMLFGLKRVGPRLHFMATCLVAAGTLISTFWILAANSWMQTPAGFARTPDGRFIPTSWVHALFNPSFPYRYMHTVVAAYLTTALVVGGVGAFHLLKDKANPRARLMFSMPMWMTAIFGPVQIGLGDQALLRHPGKPLEAGLVRSRRLELPRVLPHKHLKLARLPFRHDRSLRRRGPSKRRPPCEGGAPRARLRRRL